MPETTRNLSWEEVMEFGKRLAEKVRASGFVPEYLIGITAGGLVPLALLAEELDIRNVITVSARSYEGRTQGALSVTYVPQVDLRGARALLVDEVAETGETLRRISEAVVSRCNVGELRTATLAVNKVKCRFRPDFFAIEDVAWVAFPWEKESR